MLYMEFNVKIDESKSANNAQTNITKNDDSGYMLKEYKGKIAVFEGLSKEPKEIFDVYVDSFPETDQKALKKGIRVSTRAELQSLIEDYTS